MSSSDRSRRDKYDCNQTKRGRDRSEEYAEPPKKFDRFAPRGTGRVSEWSRGRSRTQSYSGGPSTSYMGSFNGRDQSQQDHGVQNYEREFRDTSYSFSPSISSTISNRESDHSQRVYGVHYHQINPDYQRNSSSENNRGRDQSQRGHNARGRGGRGGGRGDRGGRGGKKKPTERPEFFDQMESRPKTVGDKKKLNENSQVVELTTNFFKVKMRERFSVTQYHVDFPRDVHTMGLKRGLIQNLPRELGSLLYDGGSSVYLLNPLEMDGRSSIEIPSVDRKNQCYYLKFRNPRSVKFTNSNYLQILNLAVRDAMHCMKFQLVGSNYFDASRKIDISIQRVQLWPGFTTSIRKHENDILLNSKIIHKVMRTENVRQIIVDIMRQDKDTYKEKAVKMIVGTTVLTDYNNMTYKVSDIDWTKNPNSFFESHESKVSFVDFYRTKYNKTIYDLGQPLLVVNPTARDVRGGRNKQILLIPELCRATGMNDSMRKNTSLMTQMAGYTRLSPRETYERIRSNIQRLLRNADASTKFAQNEMKICEVPLNVNAEVLKKEVLMFGDGQRVSLEGSEWTQHLLKNKMFRTKVLENWYFVYPEEAEATKNDFMKVFETVTARLSMPVKQPTFVIVENTKWGYSDALKRILGKDPLFIMAIVSPPRATEMYKVIKNTTLIASNPVPVQVINERTWRFRENQKMSVATKIAIQVNCKIGGIPWMINLNHEGLKLQGLMIIGFDVSRDPKNRKNSYGAMVASLNPSSNHGGYFFSAVDRHETGSQLSDKFGLNIIKAIKRYQCFHTDQDGTFSLPERILIYRDGVGDGQIEFVFKNELEDIKQKIEMMYASFCAGANIDNSIKPKIGFIILNKRSNAKFMLNDPRNGFVNPRPGTIVADIVTMPERYDFYMVSQNVNVGTVSPTYYNILCDDFYANRPDIMHSITYKLCHNYYNWSGTTKIPSVVQYAKKLAFLTSQYLDGPPSYEMPEEKQLFFL